MKLRFLILALLATGLSACGGKGPPPYPGQKVGKTYWIGGKMYTPRNEPDYDETGVASWYGPGFHGKYTANGEVYDQHALTAAHPTLPLPSIVRVTNLENGRSAIVRVNDRGPFTKDRIIDLSRASAEKINMKGTARVRVQYLQEETQAWLDQRRQGTPAREIMLADNDLPPAPASQSASYTSVEEMNLPPPEPQIIQVQQSEIQTRPVGPRFRIVKEAAAEEISSQSLPPPEPLEPEPVPPPASKPTHPRLIRLGDPPPNLPRVDTSGEARSFDPDTAPTSKPVEEEEETTPFARPSAALAKPAPASRPTSVRAATSRSGTYVQAGSFSSESNANKLAEKLGVIGPVEVTETEVSGKHWYRVRVGPFAADEADGALRDVQGKGVPDARLVHQ